MHDYYCGWFGQVDVFWIETKKDSIKTVLSQKWDSEKYLLLLQALYNWSSSSTADGRLLNNCCKLSTGATKQPTKRLGKMTPYCNQTVRILKRAGSLLRHLRVQEINTTGSGQELQENSFHRIFTSNVADHVGLPSLILALGPLLCQDGRMTTCLNNNVKALDFNGAWATKIAVWSSCFFFWLLLWWYQVGVGWQSIALEQAWTICFVAWEQHLCIHICTIHATT